MEAFNIIGKEDFTLDTIFGYADDHWVVVCFYF